MCPACVANAMVMAASATSGGGLLAYLVNKLFRTKTKTERYEKTESGITEGMAGGAARFAEGGKRVNPAQRRVGKVATGLAVG